MKVLLVVPTFEYKLKYPSFLSVTDFPVGFAYLSSALQAKGFEVAGLNLNNQVGYDSSYQMIKEKISIALKEIQPDLICVGGLCTDYLFLKDTIRLVRELAPYVPIVLGGGIVTHDPEYIFQTLKPDFCIIGEGEEILPLLAACLQNGRNNYEHVSNIGYWENGHSRFTKQDFNYPDINQRSFPDYEPFGIKEMLDQYSMAARYLYRYPRRNPRTMTIVAGRSCPFRCTFCIHHKKVKYRPRNVDNIIKELTVLYEKYEFNILIILDELFAVNKDRLINFSEAILERKSTLGWDFNWSFQTHASASFDRETLAVAKEAGCYFFSYGLESASPRVLASMRKKTKPSQIIGAIKAADDENIGFGGNFIFGDVAETQETIDETMVFFEHYCKNIHIFFSAIQPYPGSKLFEHCLQQGIIEDKLQYYEHIDERYFNMTKIPGILWFPWIKALMHMGTLFLWNKPVDAISCKPVAEMSDNPMVLFYGNPIIEIKAVCPFCDQNILYHDFLEKGKVKITSSGFQKIKSKIKNSKWFFNLIFLFINLFPIWKPFKLLNYLKTYDNFGKSSVVIGCPHCNRRLRINYEPEG